MGLRYKIPFKDYNETSYEVRVYRADYTGDAVELTGAPSCFVVSGTDEDFMYVPVRTSSATINVLDSDLLLDLYSINNQYAKVELMREGVLEWTGYIKPEQFTQPYVPTVQSVSVECVSAVATLENIEYKELDSVYGKVTMWNLIKQLVSSCNGGYRGVYVPWVYGATSSMIGNVLERITLIENNFIEEEMNLLEVLEAVCKFLNWTVYDMGGYLWFVDADWNGIYHLYDEAMETYSEVECGEVTMQDVGYLGSDGNTLDVVPGYNKASVKAINHVPDEVVKDEPYDILKPYANGEYLSFAYSASDGGHGVRKQFLKPMFWKMYQYDSTGNLLSEDTVEGYSASVLNYTLGALLMKEADYKSVSGSDYTPDEDVTDFDYVDSVQIRTGSDDTVKDEAMTSLVALEMVGENAVYADCAISIDCSVDWYFDKDLVDKRSYTVIGSNYLTMKVECGGRFFNGSDWVSDEVTFDVEIDNGSIKSNRNPYTPYKNISGYVIPMDFFVGTPKISIYCPSSQLIDNYEAGWSNGVKLRNLKFGYAKKDGIVDDGEDGDRMYENVVNESYMSEADEIDFEISSYNADGASFSKALLDGEWLTDNLYCKIVDEAIRPEELMIRRIVNRYGETKIKLTEGIQMTGDVNPLASLYDNTMSGKRFRMTSGEWDYERGRLTVQMQEDAE